MRLNREQMEICVYICISDISSEKKTHKYHIGGSEKISEMSQTELRLGKSKVKIIEDFNMNSHNFHSIHPNPDYFTSVSLHLRTLHVFIQLAQLFLFFLRKLINE